MRDILFIRVVLSIENHFSQFAHWLKEKYLKSGSKLVEVGSNDGTLLENFKNNINVVGFEPSKTIAELANKKNIKTINKFFNSQNLEEIKSFHSCVDVICSNVIAHIPDLKDVIKSVDKLLSSKGLLVLRNLTWVNVFKILMIKFTTNIYLCFL